ncbi:hypothetical protein [Paenibacillus gansuensis]|uniref:Zinc ribbon domain-containing protein n=1 Tax=Paenibacillus gansuensis TaxID=306542 RepID=A0ABW5P7G2_9BACL
MNLIKKVKQGATDAAKLAQNKIEMTKIKSQIASKEKEIEHHQALIGEAVFLAYQAGEPIHTKPSVIDHCKVIAQLQNQVQALEQQVLNLKNEKVCTCGHVIPQDDYYCSKCGKKSIAFKEFR